MVKGPTFKNYKLADSLIHTETPHVKTPQYISYAKAQREAIRPQRIMANHIFVEVIIESKWEPNRWL